MEYKLLEFVPNKFYIIFKVFSKGLHDKNVTLGFPSKINKLNKTHLS